jgi:hypothetical protein
MKAEFTEFNNDSPWVEGKVENYKFEAKIFDEGSEWGIEGGRVSKLTIANENDEWLVNYDRGWDIKPEEKYIEYYNAVMDLLENAPKRIL